MDNAKAFRSILCDVTTLNINIDTENIKKCLKIKPELANEDDTSETLENVYSHRDSIVFTKDLEDFDETKLNSNIDKENIKECLKIKPELANEDDTSETLENVYSHRDSIVFKKDLEDFDETKLNSNIDKENIKECLKIKPELANEDDTSETLENVYSHRDSIVFKKDLEDFDETKLNSNIDKENIKECLKIKPELANEDDTSETLENVYSHRDSIVFKKDFDEPSNKSSGYEAQLENQVLLRDLIVYDEDLPMHKDYNVRDNRHLKTFKNSIVFQKDLEDLYKNHTFKDEIIVGPEVLQDAAAPQDGIFADVSTAKVNKNKKCSKNYICDRITIKKCKTKYICDHCGKSFLNKLEIASHMQIHMTKIKQLPYDQKSMCPRKLPVNTSLNKHMKTHKNIKNPHKTQGLHECDICHKVFTMSGNLKRHLNLHRGIAFQCDKCSKSYRTNESLQHHKVRLHNDSLLEKNTLIPCRYCSKHYNHKSNRNRHERLCCPSNPPRAKVVNTRIMQCDICQKTYLHKQSFINHMLLHMGKQPNNSKRQEVQCDVCLKKYKRKTGLRLHIQSAHMDAEKFKNHFCKICKKGFIRKYSLTHHEKTCQRSSNKDEREHKFGCKLCLKKYITRSGLKFHMDAKHLNVDYMCDNCGVSFTRMRSLNYHEKKCLFKKK